MAATPSTMLALGTAAPEFDLPDTRRGHEGERVRLADFAGSPLLVMFLCNHCPFVKWLRDPLAALVCEYQPRGLAAVGISANDVETHPDDSPAKMTLEAAAAGYSFPYLYDESQAVAKAYRAACTPDFFLFDRAGKLAYRGQFDDSRPAGRATPAPGAGLPVTGADLRQAIDSVLAGKPAPQRQVPSLGCNIKWKRGNEPDYFK
jgi:peroxiredoxin